MKRLFCFLILFSALSSCNLLRNVDKKQSSAETDTQTQTKTKRTTEEKVEGGEISSDIIPERERLIDSINGVYAEFVKTFKDGGLTKTIYYRPDGSVQVDCEQEDWYRKIIEDILQQKSEEKKEEQSSKDTQKELTTNINWTWVIIAAFASLAIIIDRKF